MWGARSPRQSVRVGRPAHEVEPALGRERPLVQLRLGAPRRPPGRPAGSPSPSSASSARSRSAAPSSTGRHLALCRVWRSGGAATACPRLYRPEHDVGVPALRARRARRTSPRLRAARSASRTAGVQRGSGPSSKVSVRVRHARAFVPTVGRRSRAGCAKKKKKKRQKRLGGGVHAGGGTRTPKACPPAPKAGVSTNSTTPARARDRAARGPRRIVWSARDGRTARRSIDHPNRDKAAAGDAGRRDPAALVSAALVVVVTIGGWDALAGRSAVLIAYIVVYLLLAFFVARWNRGVLPVAAALAIILLIFAAIAAPGWFDRDKDRLRRPGARREPARPRHAAASSRSRCCSSSSRCAASGRPGTSRSSGGRSRRRARRPSRAEHAAAYDVTRRPGWRNW